MLEQKAQIKDTGEFLKEMRDQSYQLLRAFEKGDFRLLGEVLDYGWWLKKRLANSITNPEIDAMYQRAKEAGAIGGKIAGAGGGGFLLLFVPLDKQDKVRQALAGYKELPFQFEQDGVKSIFNIRRFRP